MSNTTTEATTATAPTFGPFDPASIVTAYAAMSASEKSTARHYADDAMKSAIKSGDIVGAGAWMTARESLVTTVTKSPVDHAMRVSELAASLIAAAHDLARIGVTIDGTTYRATMDAEVDPAIVARVSVVTTRKANRGAVVAWIESVVDDSPATIATLRNRWVATDDYPKSAPSAGAIGAAFNRVDDGAEADFVTVDVDGKRGAMSA